jgi:hypothetical protein
MVRLKKARRELPPAEFLLERLDYRDGALFWRERSASDFPTEKSAKIWNRTWAGKRAGGAMGNGYRMVAMLNTKFLEHRIIYQMMIGPLSHEVVVDHIDRDPTNNRPENLRACSHSQNHMNEEPRGATSGAKHVYWSRAEKKYKVQMRADGRVVFIGTFADFSEAKAAAEAARQRLHGDFAHPKGVAA